MVYPIQATVQETNFYRLVGSELSYPENRIAMIECSVHG